MAPITGPANLSPDQPRSIRCTNTGRLKRIGVLRAQDIHRVFVISQHRRGYSGGLGLVDRRIFYEQMGVTEVDIPALRYGIFGSERQPGPIVVRDTYCTKLVADRALIIGDACPQFPAFAVFIVRTNGKAVAVFPVFGGRAQRCSGGKVDIQCLEFAPFGPGQIGQDVPFGIDPGKQAQGKTGRKRNVRGYRSIARRSARKRDVATERMLDFRAVGSTDPGAWADLKQRAYVGAIVPVICVYRSDAQRTGVAGELGLDSFGADAESDRCRIADLIGQAWIDVDGVELGFYALKAADPPGAIFGLQAKRGIYTEAEFPVWVEVHGIIKDRQERPISGISTFIGTHTPRKGSR